ncbi:MAG TPA: hypothetical protein VH518_18125 [Tepidisphaeraceae bacterium]|jgi:hypothetical protein
MAMTPEIKPQVALGYARPRPRRPVSWEILSSGIFAILVGLGLSLLGLIACVLVVGGGSRSRWLDLITGILLLLMGAGFLAGGIIGVARSR